MRSRPKVALFLRPAEGAAGQTVRAELELDAGSATPVEFVDVWLTGVERAYRDDDQAWAQTIVSRKARFTPGRLTKGKQRFAADFALPENAPPSYQGRWYSTEYAFDVHVSIPWWPDRHARFALPVAAEPVPPEPARPQVWSSSSEGPKDKRPYLEVSLVQPQVAPGEPIEGTLAVTNLTAVRRLEVAFVGHEHVTLQGKTHTVEVQRLVARLDGAHKEGVGTPFRVRFPKDAPPTFFTRSMQMRWHLVVRAVVGFGDDVVMHIPIVVSRLADAAVPESKRRRAAAAAPVGRERRALLWRAAAERLSLRNDAARERMVGTFGGVGLTVRLEQRPDGSLWVIGECQFRPALAAGLAVRERRWLDALGNGVPLPSPLHERLFAEATVPEVVATLLGDGRAFAAVEEVSMDDEGAMLAAPASVQSTEALVDRITPLLAAAQALGEARDRLPDAGGTYR
ncbi:MAG: arrestin family protein [Verrucomicrobia bacterium]|nr:arrestin family protein [Verrucomicrobiota bacterium]